MIDSNEEGTAASTPPTELFNGTLSEISSTNDSESDFASLISKKAEQLERKQKLIKNTLNSMTINLILFFAVTTIIALVFGAVGYHRSESFRAKIGLTG